MSVASSRPGFTRIRAGLTACFLALVVGVVALAANFPPLSGRVVDQANIIPADQRVAIEAKLEDLSLIHI